MCESAVRSSPGVRLLVGVLLLVGAPAMVAAQGRRGEDESAALVEEGRAALRARAYDDAAEALDAAIALNPRRIDAYVLRATVHAARTQYADGIALLRKARALAPDNRDVLAALGVQLVLAGKTAEGVPLLERVVADAPGAYGAQSQLGRYYAAQARWADAIVALEAYLRHRPTALAAEDPVHQLDLAEAYLRRRRPHDARALYDRVLKVRPGEPAARLGRAWALAAIDCRQAMPALSRLADLVAAHPAILLVEGQCALATDDAAGALALGERYLEAAPQPVASGWALVGEAAAATGDLARARAALIRRGSSSRRAATGRASWRRCCGARATARARWPSSRASGPRRRPPTTRRGGASSARR